MPERRRAGRRGRRGGHRHPEPPDRLNSLEVDTVDRLVDALAEAAASPARVVVLAGAGKAFCAGADQGEMVPRDAAELERIVRHYLDPVRRSSPWTSLFVGGAARRRRRRRTRSGHGVRHPSRRRRRPPRAPFTRIGLAGCDMSTGWFLPRLVGLGTATELMLTGR